MSGADTSLPGADVINSTEESRRSRPSDRRAIALKDFTADEIALIAASEVPPGYEHLDEELP